MDRSRSIVLVAVLAAASLGLLACATILHGSSQDVGIASQPTGASVTVDNQMLGHTPVVAKLKRKDKHTIAVALDGYQPFEVTTTRSTSGWVWGNIVFGGLIGLQDPSGAGERAAGARGGERDVHGRHALCRAGPRTG